MNKIDPKKAIGFDGIPAKLIKIASNEIAGPITQLFNKSISTSSFPHRLKFAEVSTLYKSKDIFDKINYRPLSILSGFSKIFERIFYYQLYSYFENNCPEI